MPVATYQDEVHQQLLVKANALDRSNQLLQAVINTSPTGLALLKPIYVDHKIIDFVYLVNNPKSAVITGLSQDAMIGQSLLTLFPHLLTSGVFDKMVTVIQTGESQQFQLLDKLPTGAFWGDFSLVRVENDLLFSVNDITHTKQIEEELRQTNANLERNVAERTTTIQELSAINRAILQYAGLAIAATDVHGIIQLVNPALEEFTGYSADELVGKVKPGALREPNAHNYQIDQLKPDLNKPEVAGEAIITAYIEQHDFIRRENTLLTKDGQLIPVLSTISGFYDDQKNLLGFVDIITDISNLKAVEQALIKANERAQLAIRAGKLGIWEWNLETNEFTLDDFFYKLLHIPSSIRIQHLDEIKQLVHPGDMLFFNQYEQAVRTSKSPFNLELRVINPISRITHYIRVDGIMAQPIDGANSRMVGMIRDRTHKRMSEQALQASENKYRSLVGHMKEAVFQTDSNGLWTYLNPAWEEITGFSVDESIGQLFLNHVLTDDQARNQALFEPMIARQKKFCRHVVRYRHKDGDFRWIDVFAQLTLDDQNQITGTAGTLTDITERKKAEDTLQESEQRFREIAENVDELFWIRDSNNPQYLYINRAFEQLSGIPLEEIYANPQIFLSTILEEDRPLLIRAFTKPEPGLRFQFRARHQDGSLRWLSARLVGIQEGNKAQTRLIGIATDITPLIEKEQILKDSLEKEQQLNDLKSQFIATASHEFRTPLTAISTSIDLLKYYANLEAGNPITPAINKHANNISLKVMALNELIVDTLTISKLNEGKQEVNLELTDLTDLVETLIALDFCDRPDKRQVAVQTKGQATDAIVDKKLMVHVLTNLLTNAFKFSTGNPVLTIRYEPETCSIDVMDNGRGIPKKDIPNLFSKFFRASNAKDIKGTGLGLSICLEYITLQNGVIEIDSTEDVGTTFTVTLPIG
ncbi:PAS domain S-box protein [Spirosoma pollinicola]|uniref:PAS domain S-box protein n=1 Tax=Spirosoma pollinicola TaxID=2057025 RepID=UPI001474C1C4|nr:PAS domain S-box protein [Spirosoma pollinicola]